MAQVRQTADSDPIGRVLLTEPFSAMSVPSCTLTDTRFWRNQGWYDNAITVDPRDPNIVWVGGLNLYRSSDGGRTWGFASWWSNTDHLYVHADQHWIVFHPGYDGVTNQAMFVTNDGGVFKTQNARASIGTCASPFSGAIAWSDLNHGYGVTQFYFGLPYPDGTRYLGGTQDNGTVRGSDSTGPNAWEKIQGGDGGWVAIDPRNTDVIYVTEQGGLVFRSNDGGRSFAFVRQVGNVMFLAPLIMDPNAPDRLWTAGAQMWRSDDGAFSWKAASAPASGSDVIISIAVAPGDSNRVVAGTAFGRVYRTTSALTTDRFTAWASSVVPGNAFVAGVTFVHLVPKFVVV